MKWLPRTLFGQVLLALFAGMLAAQVAGAWLLLDERSRLDDRLRGEHAAQRVANALSIIDDTDPGLRPGLVKLLGVGATRIELGQGWSSDADRSEPADALALRIGQELGRSLPLQLLQIRDLHGSPEDEKFARENGFSPRHFVGNARGPDAERRRSALLVIGQARLTDGSVLTFRHYSPGARLDTPRRIVGLLVLLGTTVALLSAWAVRRVTRPLASLANAATGLARDIDQAPLAEDGPAEVAGAAREFNRMQRELKRLLETRGQALAAVSHDLRLPITRMRLRLERLAEGSLKNSIENDLREMEEMIGQTLEFLRSGSISEPGTRLDFNALLESVVGDYEDTGLSIRLNGRVREPIQGRPQALRRCLCNLIDNAKRYGPGELSLTVSEQPDAIAVAVEDRGPGISNSEMELVFEPYVRLEASRARHTGGSGLGLSIARAVARTHGGDLVLRARDGGGLAAVLTLPKDGLSPADNPAHGPG